MYFTVLLVEGPAMPIQAEFSRLLRNWQLQALICTGAAGRDTSYGSVRA